MSTSESNREEELELEYLHDTPNAVLVKLGSAEVWLPRSQCEFDPETTQLKRHDLVTVTLPNWLALKSGLI